jgi:CRISPR-associated protein Cmr6
MQTYLNTIRIEGTSDLPMESPSLLLNKFASFTIENERFAAGDKKKHLEKVAAAYTRAGVVKNAPTYMIPASRSLYAELGWRLILNLGGGLIENSGINLHPFFNYPEIPGSSVKGLARHAALSLLAEENDTAKKITIAADIATVFGWGQEDWQVGRRKKTDHEAGSYISDFELAFGSDEWETKRNNVAARLAERHCLRLFDTVPLPEEMGSFAGSVAFLAGRPEEPSKTRLSVDIVNCHHANYYQGKSPVATDTEDPILNYFIAAEKGKYLFTVRKTNRASNGDLTLALGWLKKAISIFGIGGKTAAGYGWFIPENEGEENARQEKLDKNRRDEAAKKAESKRKEALGPEEREAEKLWDQFPENDKLAEFKGRIGKISDPKRKEEQKALITLCLMHPIASKAWADMAKTYTKLLSKPAKQEGDRDFNRVKAVLEVAKSLSIDMGIIG